MDKQIHLDREEYNRAVEVADGFWIVATHHRPGFSKMNPDINNRCMIFRVRDDQTGKPVLLIANGVEPQAIPEVRRLERETGLEVRYILSVGGGHHLLLPAWRDEFDKATVLVGPARIPRTPSAKTLMAGQRVAVMNRDNPLPQFAGQLDVVLFRGLYGLRDHPTPKEGGPEANLFRMMKMMMKVDDPTDELWLYHAQSRTVIGGENLGWILSEKTLRTFPWLLRQMMKADTVYIQDKARKVADRDQVAACWRQILKWQGRTLMGYHEPPGEAFLGDVQATLGKAVQAVGQLPAAPEPSALHVSGASSGKSRVA
jgi:hypothetical protein